jgi:glutamate racemase
MLSRTADPRSAPVGFFDSGVGGKCILEAFRRICPGEDTVYIADCANCPYGNRTDSEITALSAANVDELLSFGCKLIVVACNTATAAAIDHLRRKYPDVPFVGIEPAVKPAALRSKSSVVAVLATQGTFNGRLYRETAAKFARDVTVLTVVADEFVSMVERGDVSGASAEDAVRRRLEPLLAAGADHIVLGCTHFPHLKKVMEKVVRGRAALVDPSEAVAVRIKNVLDERGLSAPMSCRPGVNREVVRR